MKKTPKKQPQTPQPQPRIQEIEDKHLQAADGAYFAPVCRDCACTN